jgi:hypothetical protein
LPAKFPEAPEGLTADQQKLWNSFPRAPWIAETDGQAIHATVVTYDLLLQNQRARTATAEAGNMLAYKFTHDADGNERVEPKENPLVTQALKIVARLMACLATVGLTPSDRTKMQMPKVSEADEDKWAGIL